MIYNRVNYTFLEEEMLEAQSPEDGVAAGSTYDASSGTVGAPALPSVEDTNRSLNIDTNDTSSGISETIEENKALLSSNDYKGTPPPKRTSTFNAEQNKQTAKNIDIAGMAATGAGAAAFAFGSGFAEGKGASSWGKGAKAGKIAGVASAVAGIGADVVKQAWGDDGDLNYTSGEKAADVGSSTVKYAAMGAAAGPWGAAAGAAVGLGIGVYDMFNKDEKKSEQSAVIAQRKKEAAAQKERLGHISADKNDYKALMSQANMYSGSYIAHNGGILDFSKGSVVARKLGLQPTTDTEGNTRIFKQGGNLKVTKKAFKKPIFRGKAIIMDGPLHSEFNNIGDKGLPIVMSNGGKIYEIERDELLLDQKSSQELNKLADAEDKDLGSAFADILFRNTKSESDNFKCINNNTCTI